MKQLILQMLLRTMLGLPGTFRFDMEPGEVESFLVLRYKPKQSKLNCRSSLTEI
jgi:hypothetical protein